MFYFEKGSASGFGPISATSYKQHQTNIWTKSKTRFYFTSLTQNSLYSSYNYFYTKIIRLFCFLFRLYWLSADVALQDTPRTSTPWRIYVLTRVYFRLNMAPSVPMLAGGFYLNMLFAFNTSLWGFGRRLVKKQKTKPASFHCQLILKRILWKSWSQRVPPKIMGFYI